MRKLMARKRGIKRVGGAVDYWVSCQLSLVLPPKIIRMMHNFSGEMLRIPSCSFLSPLL